VVRSLRRAQVNPDLFSENRFMIHAFSHADVFTLMKYRGQELVILF